MRLMFICGSFEPGKDGVGDYTRLLALELSRLGHQIAVLAWVDRYALEFSDTILNDQEQSVQVARLPQSESWRSRYSRLRELTKSFEPEVVSLQHVPWTYGRYGFGYQHGGMIRSVLPEGTRVHIMFHELWIGEQKTEPLKNRLIGILQKHSISKLIRDSKVQICHCSNPYHLKMLRDMDVDARVLPLFGNVPITKESSLDIKNALIQKSGRRASEKSEKNYLFAGVFGTVHPEWNPIEAMDSCLEFLASRENEMELVVVFAGRTGRHLGALLEDLERRFAEVALIELGELPYPQISEFFKALDFGFSTTPLSLIGKSGSSIAMLEHGLPLLVTRNDLEAPHGKNPGASLTEHACFFSGKAFDWASFLSGQREPKAMLPEVALKLLQELTNG